MGGDVVAEPAGHALQGDLEPRVLERLHPAAIVAHEVVMVLSGRVRALEACDPVAEVDSLHEPRVEKAFYRPVHARDPDPAAFAAEAFVDLLHGEAAVLAPDEVDDDTASSARSTARRAEPLERTLGPCGHRR